MASVTTDPLNKPSMIRQSALIGLLFGLTAAGIWGVWPVVVRYGVSQTLTAMDLTMLRFGVAGLLLLPFVIRRGHGGLGWGRALVLAAGGGLVYMLCVSTGLSYAPAGHMGAIVPSVMMIASALGGWFLLGDRLSRRQLVGFGVVLTGVLAFGVTAWQSSGTGSNLWIGHILFVASGLLWSVYTLGCRAWGADPLQATALVSVLSLAVFLPIYFSLEGPGFWAAPVGEIVFQAIAQGVFAAIIALLCYTQAVRHLGAPRAALCGALVPGIATIVAFPVLGEIPGTLQWVGLGAVVLGMLLALLPKRS